ncbi:MAG TPA: hypothetical protein VMU83_07575 [Hanamia sp.]|nr:hypothetical protein [Hanamia sp.]
MDTNSLPISRFKAQLSNFLGIISKPYCKATKRFFREMLYGILMDFRLYIHSKMEWI